MKKTEKNDDEAQIGFISVFRMIFGNYERFLNHYIAKEKAPARYTMIFLMGLAFNLSFASEITGSNFFYGWHMITLYILVFSIPMGYLLYWLEGSFFHILVRIAKGKDSFKKTRLIVLYSELPSLLVSIPISLTVMMLFETSILTPERSPILVLSLGFIMLCGSIYSIALTYQGIKTIHCVDKDKSVILFLVLPIGYILYQLI